MPDFRNSQVGDRVWSRCWGWGEIIDVMDHDDSYMPIEVDFPAKASTVVYTLEGKLDSTHAKADLFHNETTEDDPPPAKRKVKKTVWQNWYLRRGMLWAGGAHESKIKAIEGHGVNGYIGTFPTELEWEE